ncbi:MAG TPA: cysteate synthase, partial [Prolixibacteraceae bacterium]
IFAVTNQEAANAALLFLKTEGNDIEPAAAVAVASLIQAANEGKIDKNATIMLNITGGGIEKFKHENKISYLEPLLVFPLNPNPQSVFEKIKDLF